jgi:hypothetical protein
VFDRKHNGEVPGYCTGHDLPCAGYIQVPHWADFLGAVTITMSETELPTQDRMLYMVLPQCGHCAFVTA